MADGDWRNIAGGEDGPLHSDMWWNPITGTEKTSNFLNEFGYNAFGGAQRDAAKNSANILDQGTRDANNSLRGGYERSVGYQDPYLRGGQEDYNSMRSRNNSGGYQTGLPDQQGYNGPNYAGPGKYQEEKPFSLADLQDDPGYKFRLNQGLDSVMARNAASGMGGGGNALKDLMEYGQGFASNEANNAFNRYTNQRDFGRSRYMDDRNFGRGSFENDRNFGRSNYESDRGYGLDRFDRMASQNQQRYGRDRDMAQYGVNAADTLGNLSYRYGQDYGNNIMGGANARAAGVVGAANAQQQGAANMMNTGGQIVGSILKAIA